jgi:hypothetical protein
MRKRRVGVTAGSRQTEGGQVTDFLQVVTEMAAPLEFRTPMGTAARAAIRVRMEAWRQWRGRQLAESNPREGHWAITYTEPARGARMRRCLILRQGASPLRPPAPFPSPTIFQKGGSLSRVRKPRKSGAPLTDSLPSENFPQMRERGPLYRRQQTASRWSALKNWSRVKA